MTKNLLKQSGSKSLSRSFARFCENSLSSLGDVLLLRPANHTRILKQAISDPNMSMGDIKEELDSGAGSFVANLPMSSSLIRSMPGEAVLVMALTTNAVPVAGLLYAADLLLTGGSFSTPGFIFSFGVIGFVGIVGKAKLMDMRIDNSASGYMRNFEKKVRQGRCKKQQETRQRMRQVIG